MIMLYAYLKNVVFGDNIYGHKHFFNETCWNNVDNKTS